MEAAKNVGGDVGVKPLAQLVFNPAAG